MGVASPLDVLLKINAIVYGTQNVAALAGAIGVLSTAALGLGTAMVVARGQPEQTETAFTTLLGSVQKSKAFIADLQSG